MKTKTLKLLNCPYCNSNFKLEDSESTFSIKKTEIEFGIVSCICDRFPIIDGILYLKKVDLLNKEAVRLVENKEFSKLETLLLEERKKTKIPYYIFLFYLTYGYLIPFNYLTTIFGFFTPESNSWFEYMSKRIKRPTFFLSLFSINYFKKKSTIVDVGCSAGWFLSYINSLKYNLIGIDSSWSALLLAKKYFLKNNVDLICLDVQFGFPLKNKIVDFFTFNDSFMYIKNKKFILSECVRTGKKRQITFLNHVHNSGANNMGQGYGFSAREVRSFLKDFNIWFTDDKNLFVSLTNNLVSSYKMVFKNFSYSVDDHSSSYIFTSKNYVFKNKKPGKKLLSIAKNTIFDYKEDKFV
jgi:SAM-dependent methyltransferase/uncharacterized protein YbaR (Trm112 family)